MEILIPFTSWDTDLRTMRQRHSDLAGTKRQDALGTIFVLSDSFITQAEIDLLLTKSVQLNKVTVYILQPVSILQAQVPLTMPDSTYIDADGVVQNRVYNEYAPFFTTSVDGLTVLMQCAHVQYGGTTANGTYDTELRLWLTEFGSIICKMDRNILMNSVEWQPVE